jgi:hypothetical protein
MSTWRRIRLAALRARVETGIEADGHRDWVNGLVVSLIEELEREDDELFALRDKLQQTKTQLAGCSVAALGWSVPGQEAKPGDYWWSTSYGDVLKLRQAYETMTAERDKESADLKACLMSEAKIRAERDELTKERDALRLQRNALQSDGFERDV